ncbi:hypothetical protein [Larkinella rosea]|uniref:Uncharacterized protein n=1 Tax=Larkinella rosea TaxID=2025312 RepID=A0A3P1BTG1_9BACT|nr:hypothetical protein [Larkinella rosea]RRB04391.1 hypothetical protein EHT25_12885 [Larkinella rosea]
MSKKLNFVCGAILLCINTLYAQTAPAPAKPKLFYIHEDPVYAAKVSDFEKVSKELIDQYKKYSIPDSWITIKDQDNKYYTIVPIENMASLDHDPMAPLVEKMGKDAFRDIFKAFDQCYPSHRDYIVRWSNSLSYMPGGENEKPSDFPYRKYYYIYYKPENQSKVGEVAKKMKDLNVSKGGKLRYNAYISGFGNSENFLLIEEVAKSEDDYKTLDAYDKKMMGDEVNKLLAELKGVSIRMETKLATVRPDLSYSLVK